MEFKMFRNTYKRRSSANTRGLISSAEKELNQLAALKNGKIVYNTIKNPEKSQTNKPFIRVLMKKKLLEKEVEKFGSLKKGTKVFQVIKNPKNLKIILFKAFQRRKNHYGDISS